MNTRTLLQGMTVLGLALSAVGCASPTPKYDAQFGTSVRATMAAQVLDPAAVRNTDPVLGMDSHAAQAAHERYQESFKRPPTPERSLTTGVR